MYLTITAKLNFLDGEAITQSLRDGSFQLTCLALKAISLNETSMNSLSKFLTRQQSLKTLSIMHLAESARSMLNKLSDKALSNFFTSLGKCASESLEKL